MYFKLFWSKSGRKKTRSRKTRSSSQFWQVSLRSSIVKGLSLDWRYSGGNINWLLQTAKNYEKCWAECVSIISLFTILVQWAEPASSQQTSAKIYITITNIVIGINIINIPINTKIVINIIVSISRARLCVDIAVTTWSDQEWDLRPDLRPGRSLENTVCSNWVFTWVWRHPSPALILML